MFTVDPVFAWLQECERTDQPVRLINTFRGIPVAYPVRVISVNAGTVVLGVNEYQAVCLTLDRKTHMQHPGTSEVLCAQVVSVDVLKKEALITEFTKASGSLGKRLCTRVQPTEPIDAEMRFGEHLLPCQLVDISLTGVGVSALGTYTYGDLKIHRGAKIQLHFTLPPTHTPVQLASRVTSVRTTQDANQRRLGCRIFPKGNVDLLLLEYVALRRDELMRELGIIYTTMQREQSKVAPFR
jgi:hypothetical protein